LGQEVSYIADLAGRWAVALIAVCGTGNAGSTGRQEKSCLASGADSSVGASCAVLSCAAKIGRCYWQWGGSVGGGSVGGSVWAGSWLRDAWGPECTITVDHSVA